MESSIDSRRNCDNRERWLCGHMWHMSLPCQPEEARSTNHVWRGKTKASLD
jgi:hypothetical protein